MLPGNATERGSEMKAALAEQEVSLLRARLRRRTARQRGQSLIVAVLVLFLLLVLGGIFISLIAGNLRSAQRSSQTSASARFAEAGMNYLDQQLTNAPEGADWRPVPNDPPGDFDNDGDPVDINPNDPDYFWLQEYQVVDTRRGSRTFGQEHIGGYTRVNFGGEIPGAANQAGRALVRVTYRPDLPSGVQQALPQRNALSRYIKLEVVGRVGRVDERDPTTYRNTESVSQRVELVAYKAINLNENVRQVTNKDNKPGPFSLGSPSLVYDQPANGNARSADPNAIPQPRYIESLYEGGIRVNGPLTFYGSNRFALDPNRGDVIAVAGPISLNNINPQAGPGGITANSDTQVYVNSPDTPNVFPSSSGEFNTLGGLVRDNPRGSETSLISVNQATNTDLNNLNLRAIGRVQPPLIDAPIGPNGLTRYRALTRDAAPMAPRHMPATQQVTVRPDYAGVLGWGANFYLNNRGDIQARSEALAGAYSLRADWLGPENSPSGGYWKGDFDYVPPATIITLYPRYFTVQRSEPAPGQRTGVVFRRPDGSRVASSTIVRYTYDAANLTLAPSQGLPLRDASGNTPVDKYAGYPADLNADGVAGTADDNIYSGEFVFFTEGNVRVRGVAGGLDPETGRYFKRHLTLVSNGTIYIDGNLLRDNITTQLAQSNATAAAVKGKSSIALLAKDYITVNTTQFMTPANLNFETEPGGDATGPFSLVLNSNQQMFPFRVTFGPVRDNTLALPTYLRNTTPPYLGARAAGAVGPSLFMRHAAAGAPKQKTAIKVFLNFVNAPQTYNYMDFLPSPETPAPVDTQTLFLSTGQAANDPLQYADDRFDLPLNLLFGAYQYPYANVPPAIGQDNFMAVALDRSQPETTADYRMSRLGVAPLDIRIEALMYAQEGSFFIIPGPWMNPNRNDTFRSYTDLSDAKLARNEEAAATNADGTSRKRVNERFPFHKEPMDVRITFFGQINENVTAEVGDQAAWLEKWGWIPRFYGSSGLPTDTAQGYPDQGATLTTIHGPSGTLANTTGVPVPAGRGGNGIVFEFDDRALTPWVLTTSSANAADAANYEPIRRNPYRPVEPLPITPRLPVAPGLLYYGQNTRIR